MTSATTLTVENLLTFPESAQEILPEIGTLMLVPRPESFEQLIECRKPAIAALIRAWRMLYKQTPISHTEATDRLRRIGRLRQLHEEARDGITLPPDRRRKKYFNGWKEAEVYLDNDWHIAPLVDFEDPDYVEVAADDGRTLWIPQDDWRIRCTCKLCDPGQHPAAFAELWILKLKEANLLPNDQLLVF